VHPSSAEALAEVIGVLHKKEISYILAGVFSSNVYGNPRSANAAEFVIDHHPGVLKVLGEALGNDFTLDSQISMELQTGTLRNILTYNPTQFDIELFRLGLDPHDRERFARRRHLRLPDLSIDAVLPTAEDVVIQKLRWGRDKDLADARVVIAVQAPQLDWGYLRSWTDRHGTTAVLDRLLSELKISG
jgi:hypothetical protein